jgi:DNA repair exonuclease SbcCD nuclease subunit
VRAFSVPGCPPVFISPGNHDPASNDNAAWNPRLLHARGTQWPAHVHIFDQPRWTAVPLASSPEVRIWGRAFLTSSGTMDRPLAKQALEGVADRPVGSVDIAVFHGSREGRCPPAQKITAPFSDAEVAASPFHYHAAGHYHQRSDVEQLPGDDTASSGVRLAYAGSPIALDYTEPGEHGAIEVLVRYGNDGCIVGTDLHRLDRRRVLSTQADVTGCGTPEQVDRRILHAFAAAGVTQNDFTKLTLTGRLSPGARWSAPGPDVFARVPRALGPRRGAPRPPKPRCARARTAPKNLRPRPVVAHRRRDNPDQRVALRRALYYGSTRFACARWCRSGKR